MYVYMYAYKKDEIINSNVTIIRNNMPKVNSRVKFVGFI